EQYQLNKLRDEAVKNVWNAGGVELIKNLVDQVSHAGLVGFHLLSHLNDENAVIEMIEQTSHGTDKEKFFARCVSGSAYDKFGNSWAQLLLSKAKDLRWSSEEVVNILLNFPDSQKT